MDFNKSSGEKFFNQQEHRQITRLWKKAMEKMSPTVNFEELRDSAASRRNLSFDVECEEECDPEEERKKFSSEVIQKKMMKGKSIPKIKSVLQKFDEIVTKELTTRRMSEDKGGMPYDSSKNWSTLQFDAGRSKLTIGNKVSQSILFDVEKEVSDFDPSNAQNAALMEAIEKLAQAQAFCRFDAAVKAAEAATASVPPEMAEEVAMACAKDYQAEIVDIINEKLSMSEERKPIEVIGYIGVTKLRETA